MLPIIQLIMFCLHACCQKYKIKIYKIVILHVVLHGCETGSLTVMREHRLGMFKNKLQRRIYGIMREEIAAANRLKSLMIYTPFQILD